MSIGACREAGRAGTLSGHPVPNTNAAVTTVSPSRLRMYKIPWPLAVFEMFVWQLQLLTELLDAEC